MLNHPVAERPRIASTRPLPPQREGELATLIFLPEHGKKISGPKRVDTRIGFFSSPIFPQPLLSMDFEFSGVIGAERALILSGGAAFFVFGEFEGTESLHRPARYSGACRPKCIVPKKIVW